MFFSFQPVLPQLNPKCQTMILYDKWCKMLVQFRTFQRYYFQQFSDHGGKYKRILRHFRDLIFKISPTLVDNMCILGHFRDLILKISPTMVDNITAF